MSKSMPRCLICLGALAMLALALGDPPGSAQPPKPGQKQPPPQDQSAKARNALMELVPQEAALCLVVSDLRLKSDGFMKAHWVKALQDSPLAKVLGDAPELLKLAALRKQIQKYVPGEWEQLEKEIVGDAVVYAYRPPQPGDAEQEGALLLLDTSNPRGLRDKLQDHNQAQLATGAFKVLRTHQHKQETYFERVEENSSQFYWLDGSRAAFSGQEAMLKTAIDRKLNQERVTLQVVRHLREAGAYKALASVWINPRAYDGALKAKAAELGDSSEGKGLARFLSYWKALEGVSLSLVAEQKPELVIAVHAQSNLLPDAARRVVADMAKPSEVWGALPKDSILAAAGRADLGALLETFDLWFPDQADEGLTGLLERALGLPLTGDLLKEMTPHVGPDWGLSMAAPAKAGERPQVLFALRLRPDGPDLVESLRARIEKHLRSYRDQTTLTKVVQDGIDIYCVDRDAANAKGLRPAFARKAGYLLIASSPEALVRFGTVAAPAAIPYHSPVMKLSLQAAAMERAVGSKQLEPWSWALDLFNRGELVQRTEGNNVAWIFRLHTAEPSK
jgi:hypothetical protein